ncbi:MAG: MBL fold metallo-hydrolase [Ignavibacteriaceae bacterium]|nr:MBL fold metallo-hydrolase [Ignavibacteriaceae bacterium]
MKSSSSSIVFVGTSSGKTSLKRFHSSLLLKSPSFNLLIDCGDGISRALLTQQISLDLIDGILISHLHPDHSAGLPSLIVQMKQLKRLKNLKIFCHKNLVLALKNLLHQTFVFTENATFRLEYFEYEHEEVIEISNYFSLISKQNSHLDKYKKYLGESCNEILSSSFLFNLDGIKVYYSGDILSKQDLFLFEPYKPEIIITEMTHIDLENLVELIETVDPKRVYLTHISDALEKSLIEKLAKFPSEQKHKVVIASDGLSVDVFNTSTL